MSSLLGDLPLPDEPQPLTDRQRVDMLRAHLEQARDLVVQHLGEPEARKLWNEVQRKHLGRGRPGGAKTSHNYSADELLRTLADAARENVPGLSEKQVAGRVARDLVKPENEDVHALVQYRDEGSISKRIRTLRKATVRGV